MDTIGIITVTGVISSLVFGVMGIYFAVRKQKYPGEITFIKENTVSLFDEIVEHVENLQIIYKNQPIQRNLVLLTGHLLNTGSIDITQEKVKENLMAILPEGYKWLESRIIATSSGIEAHLSIPQENELCFNLGLFRRDETISFQALAQIPPSESEEEIADIFDKVLRWQHRIAETKNNIQKTTYSPNRYSKTYWFLTVIFSVFTITAPLIFLIPQLWPICINYEITTKDNHRILVRLVPHLKGPSDITGIDTKYEEKIDFEKFLSEYNPKPVLSSDKLTDRPIIVFMIMMYPILGIFLFVYRYVSYRKNKNLEKLINKSRDEAKAAQPRA
jgi:hypothetical protein